MQMGVIDGARSYWKDGADCSPRYQNQGIVCASVSLKIGHECSSCASNQDEESTGSVRGHLDVTKTPSKAARNCYWIHIPGKRNLTSGFGAWCISFSSEDLREQERHRGNGLAALPSGQEDSGSGQKCTESETMFGVTYRAERQRRSVYGVK
jgi:hypothetical protein